MRKIIQFTFTIKLCFYGLYLLNLFWSYIFSFTYILNLTPVFISQIFRRIQRGTFGSKIVYNYFPPRLLGTFNGAIFGNRGSACWLGGGYICKINVIYILHDPYQLTTNEDSASQKPVTKLGSNLLFVSKDDDVDLQVVIN